MTKSCTKCNTIKNTNDFYKQKANSDGLRKECKDCHKESMKNSFCRTAEYKANYRKNNLAKHKEYAQKHKESHTENLRQYHKDYAKAYRLKNKESYNKKAALYKKNRKKYDIGYKLADNLRSRLWSALKNNQKTGSAIKDLGCSIDTLKTHLSSQFQPGMSWENYGKWHIDHIKPLSKFDLTNREEFLKACNYNNLQPLWASENIKKSNKIKDLK